MKVNEIYTDESIRAWLDEDTVFRVECFPGADITIINAQRASKVLKEYAGNVEHNHIIDLKGVGSVDKSARDHFSKSRESETARTKAVAIIVSSPVSRVIANFFIGFNKPKRPVRIFNSVDEAKKWFRELDKSGKI